MPRTVPSLAPRRALVAAACWALASCGAAGAATLPPAADAAAAKITAPLLAAHIRFLADDLLEGRGPGSRGELLTLRYLESQLARMGLEPAAAGGGFEQRFEIVGIDSKPPASWRFRGARGDVDLAWWSDYVAAAGRQAERSRLDGAELVFVGYGIQAPEYGWDDFKGADLKGKVLLMLNNDPDWDAQLFEGPRRLYYGRWTYKFESAARQGAAGAVIVHTTPSAAYPWQVVQSSFTGEQFELPAGNEPRVEVTGWATEAATRRLAAAAGRNWDDLLAAAKRRDFRPMPLGLTTSLAFESAVRRKSTANVLGLLPGADPKLAGEVVILTAHHDHLGIGRADASGDTIYNGAVDNAAGVAQVLAIAEALVALPVRPRRSVLFLFVAVEEQGLLGSKHYAAHPTFPPGKIAANVNFDAGNLFGKTRDVTYIGYGKSSLDAVVESLVARQGRRVVGDQFPDRGSFYRSDQFSFAQIGVPAIYLDSGTDFIGRDPEFGRRLQEEYERTRYHQPSDEVDPAWDYSGLVEDSQLGLFCTLAIANAEALPTWKPGDEFEPARRAALAAAK